MVLTNNCASEFLPLDTDAVPTMSFYKNEQTHALHRQNASLNLLGATVAAANNNNIANNNNNNNNNNEPRMAATGYHHHQSSNGYYGYVNHYSGTAATPVEVNNHVQQVQHTATTTTEEDMCVDDEVTQVEKRKRLHDEWQNGGMDAKRFCNRLDEPQGLAPPPPQMVAPAKSFLAHRDSNRYVPTHNNNHRLNIYNNQKAEGSDEESSLEFLFHSIHGSTLFYHQNLTED